MLRGGCSCGAIRYETDGPVSDETLCHCVDCRRAVGSSGVAWFTVERASLQLTSGAPRDFRSSEAATRSFCGACGTSLFYAAASSPLSVDVTTSSLDDPDAAPPKDHSFAASRPRWSAIGDALPVHAGARREG